MTRDANDLVSKGYLNLVPMFKNVSLLVVILIYQVVEQSMAGTPSNILPMIAIPVFPVVMGAFLQIRSLRTRKAEMTALHAQNSLVDGAIAVFENFPLIAD